MDFLEIRRKAKERAAARAAAAEAARAVPATGPGEVASPAAQAPAIAPPDPPRPPLALEPLPLPAPAPAPPAEEGSAAPASPAWSSLEAEEEERDGEAAPPGERPEPDPEAERAAAAEAAKAEAELEARLREMPLAADPRFRLWRPAGGQAPGPASAPEPPDRPEPTPRREEPRRAAEPQPPPASPAAGEAAGDPLDEFFYRDSEAGPGLAVLGAAAEPAAAEPEAAPRAEYLTFWLGAEEYAVAIEQVREVMRSPPITEVPRAPAGVLGVITVRGEVVAVFDPRLRLGLPPSPSAGGGRVVIVDGGAGPCGLSVDAVASVVRLPRSAIEPRPQGMGGAAADCLEGIGRERDRLFTVLSVPALLRPARSPEGPG